MTPHEKIERLPRTMPKGTAADVYPQYPLRRGKFYDDAQTGERMLFATMYHHYAWVFVFESFGPGRGQRIAMTQQEAEKRFLSIKTRERTA